MNARSLIEMALPTENHTFGFMGGLLSGFGLRPRDADVVWDHASEQLFRLGGSTTMEDVREFLDSSGGRHFSDELSFHARNRG